MAAHIRNESALALIYGTRDNYRGTFQPPVAEVREPATIVHMRRSGDCLLIAINDGGNVRLIRVGRLDSPGLELLTALDRASVQSALARMNRDSQEGGNV